MVNIIPSIELTELAKFQVKKQIFWKKSLQWDEIMLRQLNKFQAHTNTICKKVVQHVQKCKVVTEILLLRYSDLSDRLSVWRKFIRMEDN